MKKRTTSPCPSSRETVNGLCYLAFQQLLLPSLLYFINGTLVQPLTEAELNFVYYLVNFIAILVIFHDFLSRSLSQAFQHPIVLCESVILGFVAYSICFHATTYVINLLLPGYSNYNDASLVQMNQGHTFLMLVGTVILVPPAEECLYRGLIFRNLYQKSPVAAYLISMIAFASIHIMGYISLYSPLELVLAVLQYLPAGLFLAWSYTRGNTIVAPILIHAAVNYVTNRLF